MKNVMNFTIASILIGVLVTACVPLAPTTSTPQATPATTQREAQVQSVEIQVLESDPPQVNAVVRGNLSESCATLAPSQVSYSASVFEVKVYAVSPTDRGCAQVTTPFETVIPLDTIGKPAGTYTVTANGVSAVFTLPIGKPAHSTATPAPIATAVPTSAGCTNSAAFVSDVTIADYTVLAPNTAFTKTWRLKNAGSCTWDSSYLVSYISGTAMSQQPGYYILPQGQTVAPGEAVNISVGMTSPVQSGSYASYWGLKKENGALMPIQGGVNGNSFYVKIRVDDGSTVGMGKVTDASIAIELEQGSGTVCTADATYLVHANITADGPTTARYEIESSAGQIPAGNFTLGYTSAVYPVFQDNVSFDQAGTKSINLRFVGPYPYPDDITVMLRVNGGGWHNTKLPCQG